MIEEEQASLICMYRLIDVDMLLIDQLHEFSPSLRRLLCRSGHLVPCRSPSCRAPNPLPEPADLPPLLPSWSQNDATLVPVYENKALTEACVGIGSFVVGRRVLIEQSRSRVIPILRVMLRACLCREKDERAIMCSRDNECRVLLAVCLYLCGVHSCYPSSTRQ